MLQAGEALDGARRVDKAGGEGDEQGGVDDERVEGQRVFVVKRGGGGEVGGERQCTEADGTTRREYGAQQPGGGHEEGKGARATTVVPQPRVGEGEQPDGGADEAVYGLSCSCLRNTAAMTSPMVRTWRKSSATRR